MFKKPFKVKSNSQLKGSDRKKLRNDILQQFPGLTEDTMNVILPNKETIFQLKLLTHSDDIVIVYTVQKLPVIFEVEKIMYPTVYMLWQAPYLLYTFTTHPQVFPIIAGGADLMLPGVVLPNGVSLHAYGKLQKGDRVAINLTSNKAPIAVGNAANSSYDMYMSAKRGKCVLVLHYYGDFLSKYGNKLIIPESGPPSELDVEKVNFNPSSAVECSCDETKTGKSLKSDNNLNSNSIEQTIVSEESYNPDVLASEKDPVILVSEQEKENNSQESSTLVTHNSNQSMDDLLKYCFMKSLKTTMKKVELPLLTSNFYKFHMIPACPKGKILDVKKSSYKKLSNFLDGMLKLGIINVESLQKGVQRISKIDYSCELVKEFVDNITSEETEKSVLIDTSTKNKGYAPEITEKYTVTAAVLPLFDLFYYKKKELVDASVVRTVISNYVKIKSLQNTTNKKEVVLDDVLRSACNFPSDSKVVLWDQLVLKVFQQMGHSYQVELGGSEVALSKGKLSPIDIQVGTRLGNKKVTLVNNLELYGINVAEFSRECQHGVAASTTINTLPSSKSAQLQIQGNQVTFVARLLMEKYQIPKTHLRGLENTPKKKK